MTFLTLAAWHLQPTDALEWLLVMQEVEQFLEADSLPSEGSSEGDRHPSPLPIRCQVESPLAGVPFTAPFLQLHEAVLASYWHKQVKLGDLPLDMIRMLQALEWDDPAASMPCLFILLTCELAVEMPLQSLPQTEPGCRWLTRSVCRSYS